MSPERWEEVGKLFQTALALPPDGRETFLNEACEDKAMRREVESLLAASDGAGSFLAAGAMNDAAKMIVGGEPLKLVGKRLGNYQVLSQLGSGGMGEVYLAEDIRLRRRVALKLLPAELTENRDRLRRFEQEARAASALNHPNILTIYEIGQAESTPFISTEYVEGDTVRLLLSSPMKLEEVVEICIQVASALAAAHAADIIHRDIKPENIMRRHDGIVKVLDFGLAKLSEKAETGSVDTEAATKGFLQTEPGVVLGTASYMSPEQTRGLLVDSRTDIFSLGVVIYEMVTGQVPFGGATRSDLIVALLERDPPPLSRFTPEAPAELERLVMKTLAKDREQRYQSAKDLLIDLNRLKKKLEVDADIEQAAVGKKDDVAGANKATQTVANAANEGDRTQDGTARLTSSAEYLVGEMKRHKAAMVAALVVTGILVGAIAQRRFQSIRPGGGASGVGLQNPAVEKRGFRPWELKRTFAAHTGAAVSVVFSPDGKTLASSGGKEYKLGEVKIWDVQSLDLKHASMGYEGWITSLTVSADNTLLAGIARSDAGGFTQDMVHLWSMETGDLKFAYRERLLPPTLPVFSPDSKMVWSGSEIVADKSGRNFIVGDVWLWDTSTGLLQRSWKAIAFALAPDGKSVAIAKLDKSIQLVSVQSGEVILTISGQDTICRSLAFSPDGRTLASAGWDKNIRLWNTRTGELQQSMMGHNWDVEAITFSPDSSFLISEGIKGAHNEESLGEVVIWDATTGQLIGSHGQRKPMGFAIAANNRVMVIYGYGEVQVVDLPTGKLMQLLGKEDGLVRDCAFSPDSETLAVAKESGSLELWSAGSP